MRDTAVVGSWGDEEKRWKRKKSDEGWELVGMWGSV